MLRFLRYRYAKTRLAAFIDGELPISSRRLIARMIDEDRRIYEEYLRFRQTREMLQRDMPILGRTNPDQLTSMWENIQIQLQTPASVSEQKSTTYRRTSLSYSLVVGFCSIAFLLPVFWGTGDVSDIAIPHQQPQPEMAMKTITPSNMPLIEATAVAVVAQSFPESTDGAFSHLDNTPAPKTPGQ